MFVVRYTPGSCVPCIGIGITLVPLWHGIFVKRQTQCLLRWRVELGFAPFLSAGFARMPPLHLCCMHVPVSGRQDQQHCPLSNCN